MKILPFNPHTVKHQDDRNPNKKSDNEDFNQYLKDPIQPLDLAIKTISTENIKASLGASSEDLGRAGNLINTLVSQIKSSNPGLLQKLHNLDSTLYYYQI